MTPAVVSIRRCMLVAAAVFAVNAMAGPAPDAVAAESPASDAGGIDIDSLPVSTLEAGAFPYFSVPDGYRVTPLHLTELDFGQAALWTGGTFEIVEGRVHAAGIRVDRDSGKQFSAIEVTRNIDQIVKASGGVEIFSGTVPREMRGDDGATSIMRGYSTESVCRTHDPINVYALRRDDGVTWVRTCGAPNFAGLMVIDAQPLVPASELQRQLDSDGRVTLQVHFATDQAQILPESLPQIEQVVALLGDDPALRLAINGHTDSTGEAAHNLRLSQARAAAVVEALTARGILADRLNSAGFGQEQPVADNATEAGRALNRRVELVRQ